MPPFQPSLGRWTSVALACLVLTFAAPALAQSGSMSEDCSRVRDVVAASPESFCPEHDALAMSSLPVTVSEDDSADDDDDDDGDGEVQNRPLPPHHREWRASGDAGGSPHHPPVIPWPRLPRMPMAAISRPRVKGRRRSVRSARGRRIKTAPADSDSHREFVIRPRETRPGSAGDEGALPGPVPANPELPSSLLAQGELPAGVRDWLRTLSRAAEQTGDGLCITDRNGVVEYVNPAFEALSGFSRDQLVGRNMRVLRSGAHGRQFYERFWETLLAGRPFRRVLTDRNPQGALVHLDQSITPIRADTGEISHFVVAARDISPQVRAEAALRRVTDALESQAKAVAQTLHDEAGQCLTAAHIALSELGRDLEPGLRGQVTVVREHLERVEEELRRLSHELHPRILDEIGLPGALQHLADGIRRRRGVDVTLEMSLAEPLPPPVQCVIYRAVQEALGNVARHTHATRVVVEIEQANAAIDCRVTDNGEGFDVTAAAAARGQGLGLRGMQDRVEAVRGNLCITSSSRGTKVALSIPLVEP